MSFFKKSIIILSCAIAAQSAFAMQKKQFGKVFKTHLNKSTKKAFNGSKQKTLLNKMPKLSFGTSYFKHMNWKKMAAAGALATSYGLWTLNEAVASAEAPEEEKKKSKTTYEGRKAVLGDRPPEVQAASDKAFEVNKNTGSDAWLYNGSSSYRLLGLNDDLMLEWLALENHDQNDIYIIDIGCAKGDWGNHAMQVLQSEVCKKSGKRFHIFSVTGGKECKETIEQHGNVTLYQFNQFKIENIDKEFAKRGFNLKNKVNLVVSRWTLRHLADPFGTLKRICGLLVPKKGMLMSNGFLFMFNDSTEINGFPYNNENILSYANATILFRFYDDGRDAGQFLLMRNDENDLEIPLEYTGKIENTSHISCQCAANALTVFNKGSVITSLEKEFVDDPEVDNKRYCIKGDQACINLYLFLKKQGLFI